MKRAYLRPIICIRCRLRTYWINSNNSIITAAIVD